MNSTFEHLTTTTSPASPSSSCPSSPCQQQLSGSQTRKLACELRFNSLNSDKRIARHRRRFLLKLDTQGFHHRRTIQMHLGAESSATEARACLAVAVAPQLLGSSSSDRSARGPVLARLAGGPCTVGLHCHRKEGFECSLPPTASSPALLSQPLLLRLLLEPLPPFW